jgi:hypothetical protein
MGSKGLARAKIGPAGDWVQSPLAKTITSELRTAINDACKVQEGDLLFFQFGKEAVVHTVMANLRVHLAKKFGFIPEYEIIWEPLKILDGVQQEQVMASKQTRILEQFRERLLTGVEASKVLKAEGLLHMDTEVSKGLRDVEPMQMMEMQQNADAPNTKPDGKKSDK